MAKLTKTSNVDTMHQLLVGRQKQYEKLHFMIENKGNQVDIENEIEALNIRHGNFGKERKISLNNFFKSIIDNVLPKYAKYLMYAAEHTDISDAERVEKLKKYSKYQLDELMRNDKLE